MKNVKKSNGKERRETATKNEKKEDENGSQIWK